MLNPVVIRILPRQPIRRASGIPHTWSGVRILPAQLRAKHAPFCGAHSSLRVASGSLFIRHRPVLRYPYPTGFAYAGSTSLLRDALPAPASP
jgi:hypothetical protein